ncbi:ATP-binding cassette domain-containing protein [Mycobacterium sp. OAE908]|uniref:ATP-binding cassette domain-containing protein n=1 Tax=Mycobacterium sp. OAE908 TaxID=2817899 RepID=UPI001AE9E0DD
MSTSDKSVTVSGVGKSFGDVHALHDISFEVGRGEVIGLLGPNGAGKTTMVHILSTLTRPDRGQAWVAGHDVVSQAAKVRRSIMLTSQQVALDNMLTGRQNLVMIGRLQGLTKAESRTRAKALIHDFELDDAADRRVDTYSSGMRRRIDIACGLMVRPEVAFLDEPTTGLDPRSRQSIWDLVGQFKTAGITTVLTTQYLEEADALSDRIIVIDRGTIIAEGTADELKRRTGSGSCEIVPQDPRELSAIADALDTLMLDDVRSALTIASDRIAFSAPDGVATVAEVLRRLDAAGIRFADVALRRPSLDDVFFALTRETTTREAKRPTAGVT